MKRVFAVLLFLIYGIESAICAINPVNLTCDCFSQPLGIDQSSPMLAWQIHSDQNNVVQSAFRLLVSDDILLLEKDKGNIWDSGRVSSGNSVQVPYAGSPLKAGKKYFWKVKIWDQSGDESPWSRVSSWQMGLLTADDWNGAAWIGYEDMPDSMRIVPGVHGNGDKLGEKGLRRPVIPLFRKHFDISKKVASATLYISGVGQYESYINGKKAGDSFLSPGWTQYDRTVFYNTYDVTASLKKEENVIGVIVGNGFYNVNRERYRKLVIAYGMPRVICNLAIKYADGSSENIVSGNNWKTAPSPVTYSGIYGGEDYDARLEKPGWDKPGFKDKTWKNAINVKAPTGKLVADRDYPVKVCDYFVPQKVNQLSDTCYLYDFGQNASGIVELRIKGTKGQQVRLIPAELINDDGTANQKATGSPYYWTYTLKGEGTEVWRPRFTYYGFRYLQVEGAKPRGWDVKKSLPVVEGMTMLHTRNSEPQNGTFTCSNKLFNRIFRLIDWAIRSNLQSVATDCPHREKLGWLEQTFLMGNGINFNYDVYHLYRKLVYDMIDAQTSDGLIPAIAPEYVNFGGDFRDSPEWGSAGVILPWLLYRWYGDKEILTTAWPMMNKYVSYLETKADHRILSHGLGDWYDLGPKHPGYAQLTPRGVTATAIYYYDVTLLARVAEVLGKDQDRKHFELWGGEIKDAFNKAFFDPQKKIYATGSQTSMAMPLCVGLVPDLYRHEVLKNLEDSIRANGNALTAGDIGFHYLVEALTDGGASQLLFEMNNRDDVPGYGYQLKKGATTLTESWQALRGVSNNHLMLGHLMEWFYQGVGGIRQKENSFGYKQIVIRPEVVGNLTAAKTTFHSPYGDIKTEWKKTDQSYTLLVEVPANTQAEVYLPFEGEISVNNGKKIPGLKDDGVHEGRRVWQTGSGTCLFKVRLK